jgi:membrane-bound metal-dependent hydrolase YbcI (DUF457 family)
MFIGHNAVGFASKRAAPRLSLGWLMAAPMLLDLIWPILLLAGVEHVRIHPGDTKLTALDFYDYPWTHSLLMSLVWSVAFAAICFAVTRYARGAAVVGVGVFSHWVLDFITHRADLPLWPGGPKAGLGLWNVPAAELAIEAALFAVGLLVYRHATTSLDRRGSVGMWTFVLFLAAIFIANAGGAPPPNERVLAWMGLTMWLFPLWAWWFDRHREARDDS